MTPEERKALASISERIEAENELERVKIENELREQNRRIRLPQVDIPEIIRAFKEQKRKLNKVV